MATKIANADDGWHVRMTDGEYELSVPELGVWILEGRVARTQDVLPPTTKRWKHAENCSELETYFAERARVEFDARWEAQAPARAAMKELGMRRKRFFVRSGCAAMIFGILLLITGTTLGVVFGVALGAIGLIMFLFGKVAEA
jgi:hypothetical protein